MQRIEAMKWLQRLALLAVVVWSALCGAPLRAQETAGPAAPKPMVWTGDPPYFFPPVDTRDAANLAAALEKELARLKVALEVDGATEAQRKELTRLWVIASRREEFPRRWEVLPRIVIARAEELERRGELPAAVRVASELLPRAEVAAELSRLDPKLKFVAATAEQEKAAQEAAKDPKLASVRTQLEKKLAEQKGLANASERGGDSEREEQAEWAAQLLEDAVARALLEQQPAMIRDLGARTGPALERLIVNDLDTLTPDATLDPLVLLFEVDEARGAQFTLENWPKGGYLFHKRVLRAMQKAGVLVDAGTWQLSGSTSGQPVETPPKLIETAWRDVVLLAVSDAEVARDSLDSLGVLAEFDGLDTPLQAALIAWIDKRPAELSRALLALVRRFPCRTTLVPIAERALASSDANLRVLAAEFLESLPRNDALRARASDPELGVRMAIVRSFSHWAPRAIYASGPGGPGTVGSGMDANSSSRNRREFDARDSACVEALLADAHPSVRQAALKTFLEAAVLQVSTARLIELAKDEDFATRKILSTWQREEAMPVEALNALAAEPDREVTDRAMRELQRIAGGQNRKDGTPIELWNDSYLTVLETLLVNPTKPSIDMSSIPTRVGSTPDGARLAVRMARTVPNVRTFGVLGSAIVNNRAKFAWDAIGVEELPALLEKGQSFRKPSQWAELFNELPERHAAAFRAVLLDAKQAPETRLLAAFASAATADADWNSAFVDAVLSVSREFRAELASFRFIGDRLGGRDRLDALQAELAKRKGDEEVLGFVIARLAMEGNGDFTVNLPESVALDVMARKSEGADIRGEWAKVQRKALRSISFTEQEPRLDLVERLLRDPGLSMVVCTSMAQAHIDAHLPLLERAVLGEFDSADGQNSPSTSASRALVAYLDDRAAGILLKGIAATSDASRREVFFKALDEIRRFQDERERWANRKSSKAARDAAIAELVPMLADKDATIRGQAAKSLGALDAVEQLPALVRLLKDSDSNVRKAAQSAIDVLTAPKPVPPAPEAPKSGAPAKKDE